MPLRLVLFLPQYPVCARLSKHFVNSFFKKMPYKLLLLLLINSRNCLPSSLEVIMVISTVYRVCCTHSLFKIKFFLDYFWAFSIPKQARFSFYFYKRCLFPSFIISQLCHHTPTWTSSLIADNLIKMFMRIR